MGRSMCGLSVVVLCTIVAAFPGGASAASGLDSRLLPQQPVAYGTGGGAATMSPYATRAAIDVLRRGGNAVDGAVAAAAALGVAEPFVAGPGGGGFFVYYRARDHRVFTIDGREKAPSGATPELFLDAAGKPLPFDEAVESGRSVGVPGNVATWGVALDRFGSRKLPPCCARRRTSPGRASRSTAPWSARSAATRTSSAGSRRARTCSCPAARCRRSSRCCATRSRAHLPADRRARVALVLHGADRPRAGRDGRRRRRRRPARPRSPAAR